MSDFLNDIVSHSTPAIVSLFGLVLTTVITRAATVAKTRWGIEIEARHREAIHSALLSGVTAALARGLTGPAVTRAARVYAQDSVPDAIRALPQATESVLASIAEAKVREVLARAPLYYAGVDWASPEGYRGVVSASDETVRDVHISDATVRDEHRL